MRRHESDSSTPVIDSIETIESDAHVPLVFEDVPAIDPAVIAKVHKKGDALEAIRYPLTRYAAQAAVKAGLVTTGTIGGMLYTSPGPEVLRFGLYGLGAAGLAEGKRRVQKVRRVRRAARRLEYQAEYLGEQEEPLELISYKSKKVRKSSLPQLYWGAEFDSEVDDATDVRRRLERVASIAAKSNLTELVVPAKVLDFADDADDFAEKSETTNSWMERVKKLPLGLQEKEEDSKEQSMVMVLSPKECLELAQKIEETAPDGVDVFDYAWTILHGEKPRHAFLHRFAKDRQQLGDSELTAMHARAATMLRSQIGQSLRDSTVAQGPAHQRVHVDTTATILSTSPKVRIQGTQAVEAASGREEGLHVQAADSLLGALDINANELRLFFEKPGGLTTKKRCQIAEVVMLYRVSGWDLPIDTDTLDNVVQLGRPASNPGVGDSHELQLAVLQKTGLLARRMRGQLTDDQVATAERVTRDRHTNSHIWRLVGVIALGVGSYMLTDKVVNDLSDLQYAAARNEYVQQMTLDTVKQLCATYSAEHDGKECRPPEEILEQLKNSEGWFPEELSDDFEKFRGDWMNTVVLDGIYMEDQKFEELLGKMGVIDDFGDSYSQDGARYDDMSRTTKLGKGMSGPTEAGVGNVASSEDGEPDNQPVWRLQAHGDMSTEGYWSQAVKNLLVANGTLSWRQDSVYTSNHGLVGSDLKPKDVALISPARAAKMGDYIHVSGVGGTEMDEPYNEDTYYMPIPVVEGSTPVAISLTVADYDSDKEQPIDAKIQQLNDGTYIVPVHRDLQDGKKLSIEYWLVPDTGQSPYGMVKASGATAVDSYDNSDADYNPGLGITSATIDKLISDLPAQDGPERSQALAEHMRSTMTYALSPLDPDFGWNKDDRTFTNAPEYAQMVIVGGKANCNIANTVLPLDNPELNIVVGSFNKKDPNDKFDVISTSEAHMWAVGPDGHIYDATPSGGISEKDAKHFEEGFSKEDLQKAESESEKNAERQKRLRNILTAAGVIGTAAVVIRKRRKIASGTRAAIYGTRRGYRNTRANIADRRMNSKFNRQPQQVSLSLDAIDAALFSSAQNASASLHAGGEFDADYARNKLRISRLPKSAGGTRGAVKRVMQSPHITNPKTRRMAKHLIKFDHHQSRRMAKTKKS